MKASLTASLCASALVLTVTVCALQVPAAQAKKEAVSIPSFTEILGKTPQWAEENIGQFESHPSIKEWLERKSPEANQAVSSTFHIFLPDSKGKLGSKSLEIAVTLLSGGQAKITSVKWGMKAPTGFDAAMAEAKLNINDFEFVSEKSIMHSWDVTILRKKDSPKTLLEVDRKESNYSITLRYDVKAMLKEAAQKPSAL